LATNISFLACIVAFENSFNRAGVLLGTLRGMGIDKQIARRKEGVDDDVLRLDRPERPEVNDGQRR
jgi:hypothetical protein